MPGPSDHGVRAADRLAPRAPGASAESAPSSSGRPTSIASSSRTVNDELERARARRRSRSPRPRASPPAPPSHGAPVSPREPPITTTLPGGELGRVGAAARHVAQHAAVDQRRVGLARARRAGCRCRRRRPRPRAPCPARSTAPAWRAWNAAVADGADRLARAPRRSRRRRRSARRRRRPCPRAPLMSAITPATGSFGAPGGAGAEQRVDDPVRAAEHARRRRRPAPAPGACRSIASGVLAEPLRRPRRAARRPRGRRARSSRAATSPSPPLLPLPQTTAIRPAGTCSAITRARPSPARSISSSEGICFSSIAQASVARMSCRVGERLEPARGSSSQQGHRAGHALGVRERELDPLDAELRRPLRGAAARADGRAARRRRRAPRRHARNRRAGRAPSRPPPWRRSAPRGAARARPARPRAPARRR